MDRDERLARYYDLEYRNYMDDLDFFVQYALLMDPRKKLPVLELGCGTGRVLLALAKAGFRVEGVDSSAGMLKVCKESAVEEDLSERIHLTQDDMRALEGVELAPYNMAFCALNTFAYLPTTEDQLALLGAVHSRLIQHGLLILDLTPPLLHLLIPADGEIMHSGSYTSSTGDFTMHKFVSGRVEHSTQTHDVTMFYDLEARDGTLRRLSQTLALRWTGRYEMELLLRLAGFRVEKVYGGYELEDYVEGSERMIFVART